MGAESRTFQPMSLRMPHSRARRSSRVPSSDEALMTEVTLLATCESSIGTGEL